MTRALLLALAATACAPHRVAPSQMVRTWCTLQAVKLAAGADRRDIVTLGRASGIRVRFRGDTVHCLKQSVEFGG